MTSHLVWQGFAVGFLAAIPLGPMGMICVQRTLDQGWVAGLASACGLTLASAFWCVVAAQGISTMADLLAEHKTISMIGLGLLFAAAGVGGVTRSSRAVDSRVVERASGHACGSLLAHVVSSSFGVLLNPITFVTMTAVLAILGGVSANPGVQGLSTLGVMVFVGGMTVWFCVTYGITLMKTRLGETGGIRLSRALNYCILVLGVFYMIRPFLPDATG